MSSPLQTGIKDPTSNCRSNVLQSMCFLLQSPGKESSNGSMGSYQQPPPYSKAGFDTGWKAYKRNRAMRS